MHRWSALAPEMRRRVWLGVRAFLAVGVVAACVWFVLHLDWAAVGRALALASWPLVGLAVGFILAGVGFHAWRLALLLRPERTVSVLTLARYLLASSAATNLLPARVGEVLRVWLLRAREGVPTTTSVALMVVERAADVITLLMLALALPWLVPSLPPSVAWGSAVVAVGLAVGVALVLVARHDRVHARLPSWLGEIVSGVHTVGRPGLLAATLALTLAGWLAEAASITCILRALGAHPPLFAPALVLLFINLAIAVPSTPAQLGAFELGAIAALRLLGIDEGRAVAVALLCHAVQIIPVTLLGLGGSGWRWTRNLYDPMAMNVARELRIIRQYAGA